MFKLSDSSDIEKIIQRSTTFMKAMKLNTNDNMIKKKPWKSELMHRVT